MKTISATMILLGVATVAVANSSSDWTDACTLTDDGLFFFDYIRDDEDLASGTMEECIDSVGRENIISYGGSSSEFITLPEDFFRGMTSLVELELPELSSVPEGLFDGLVSLETISFNSGDIEEIPEKLFHGLSSIKEIGFGYNKFTTLSENTFDGLVTLESIRLSENELSSLPASIFDGLVNLDYLNLRDNNLVELPYGIFSGLVALEDLYLKDNMLTCVPFSFADNVSVENGIPDCTDGPVSGASVGYQPFGIVGVIFVGISFVMGMI